MGQVFLDKNPNLRTIVNKVRLCARRDCLPFLRSQQRVARFCFFSCFFQVGSIHTEFRTFEMELLAGEPKFEVTLNESGARFTFNFKEVYWNSRLQMEHLGMTKRLSPGRPVICACFCCACTACMSSWSCDVACTVGCR